MELPPQLQLFMPLLLLAYSAIFIPITLVHLLLPPQPKKLLSWPAFKHAWFGTFWSWFGGVSRQTADPVVSPLVRSNARGVVLDIGPGSGEWVDLYAGTAEKVTRVFGVEPNYEHHAALRQRVEAAGLTDVYEILPVGAQDLGTVGLELESVDTIVTVQTLCSCPGPRDIINSLYPYLKKGGTWVVYEHVKTKHPNHFVGVWQRALVLFRVLELELTVV